MDPSFSLELINGATHIVGAFFLWHMAVYLVRETHRRRLKLRAWFFKLPVSMHFAVAILVFDFGVWMKAFVVWIWRMLGAAPFTLTVMTLLWIGSLIILIGGLCKIRAITKPDRGNGPWLLAAGAVVVFVVVTMVQRA